MTDSDDVRGGDRHSDTLRIRLQFSDEAHFIERYASNISRGGIFISSRTPSPVGTSLRFEFELEGGLSVIRGEGSVAWVSRFDPARPDRQHGMGVRFLKLDDESQRVIERALAWKERKRQREEAEAALFGEAPPSSEATRRVDIHDLLGRSGSKALLDAAAARAPEPTPAIVEDEDEATPVMLPHWGPSPGEAAPVNIGAPAVGSAAEAAAIPPADRAGEPEPDGGAAVIELIAEPEDDDLPPPPAMPAPSAPLPRPRLLTPPSTLRVPLRVEEEGDGAAPLDPLPLPPPPPPEPAPVAALAPVPENRFGSVIAEHDPRFVEKPSRRPSVKMDPAALAEAIAELEATVGLESARIEEAAARARARTTALVNKLSGDAGELDWLLDPPRPEPLPSPAQARALLDRYLERRGSRG